METRTLGGRLRVPAVGLGCGAMSGTYGPADDTESIATIRAALDAGITLLDTADFYGMGHNEMLIARALRPADREKVVLSVKYGGLRGPDGGFRGVDARPAATANFLAYSLRRLGTDYVDIYRPARLDPAVPVEDTIGAIAELAKAGYVRGIGLSEVGPETIRRAHAVHPITDLQIEYSLFSRGIENGILATCRELGIGVTAYGVLAQGLLSGAWQPPAAGAGTRAHLPRFSAGNVEANLALVAELRKVADVRGVTVAQLALAWVLAQGRARGDLAALVGARRPQRIAEAVAAAQLELTPQDLAAIEHAVPAGAAAGDRYAPALLAMLDSER
jgi:aryl-alcohol dehydrogenase-like predicted oxidoreductase